MLFLPVSLSPSVFYILITTRGAAMCWSFERVSELFFFKLFKRVKFYRFFFFHFLLLLLWMYQNEKKKKNWKYENSFGKHPFQYWKENFNVEKKTHTEPWFKMVLYSFYFLFQSINASMFRLLLLRKFSFYSSVYPQIETFGHKGNGKFIFLMALPFIRYSTDTHT